MAGRGGRKASPCWEDRRQPLCPGLAGRGAPDAHGAPDIAEADLPHDERGRLLRPGVVWFNEGLDPAVLQAAEAATSSCDLFITAGTSSVVYPAAGGSRGSEGRAHAHGSNCTRFLSMPCGPFWLGAGCLLSRRPGACSPCLPAAGFAHQAAARGAAVAEFNLEATDATGLCQVRLQTSGMDKPT